MACPLPKLAIAELRAHQLRLLSLPGSLDLCWAGIQDIEEESHRCMGSDVVVDDIRGTAQFVDNTDFDFVEDAVSDGWNENRKIEVGTMVAEGCIADPDKGMPCRSAVIMSGVTEKTTTA